jgi:hypothetical protein
MKSITAGLSNCCLVPISLYYFPNLMGSTYLISGIFTPFLSQYFAYTHILNTGCWIHWIYCIYCIRSWLWLLSLVIPSPKQNQYIPSAESNMLHSNISWFSRRGPELPSGSSGLLCSISTFRNLKNNFVLAPKHFLTNKIWFSRAAVQ